MKTDWNIFIIKMNEMKMYDCAIKNCQRIEKSIYTSIKIIRRLNIRYNADWILANYVSYVAGIFTSYRCRNVDVRSLTKKQRQAQQLSFNSSLSCRSSHELCGSNRKINYKLLKIKRNMEGLVLQINRAIDIGNRQKGYVHATLRDGKRRICCH